MSIKRIDRRTIRNKNEIFEELFRKRAVKYIDHYPTPVVKKPTMKQRAKIEEVNHIWSTGDRYYKLAHKHYGDASLWWVIAWYNSKPTESHLSLGDVVNIPVPLSAALRVLRG